MKLVFEEDEQIPVSEEDIKAVEIKHKVIFPTDYKAFLLAHNGQEIENMTFKVDSGNGIQSGQEFQGFLSLEDVDEAWDYLIEECQDFEAGLFENYELLHCIGLANFSYKIFMGFTGELEGKIFLYEYQLADQFIVLADSFTDFIELLEPYSDDDLDPI